jgi:hypothetical protein
MWITMCVDLITDEGDAGGGCGEIEGDIGAPYPTPAP